MPPSTTSLSALESALWASECRKRFLSKARKGRENNASVVRDCLSLSANNGKPPVAFEKRVTSQTIPHTHVYILYTHSVSPITIRLTSAGISLLIYLIVTCMCVYRCCVRSPSFSFRHRTDMCGERGGVCLLAWRSASTAAASVCLPMA